MDDFVSDDKYFGGINVEVTGLKDVSNIPPNQKLEIVVSIITKIAGEISTKFGDYPGTKSFYREPLRKYFKDKKSSFSVNTNAGDWKATMRNDIPQEYFVDLNNDWYVYNENYLILQKKVLVKYFHNNIDEIREKFKDIYLLRNMSVFQNLQI